mgnify:CR=1 FL=1
MAKRSGTLKGIVDKKTHVHIAKPFSSFIETTILLHIICF